MTISPISTSIIPNVLPVSMGYRLSSACARALDSLTNQVEMGMPAPRETESKSGTAQDTERNHAAHWDLPTHGFLCVLATCFHCAAYTMA